MAAVTTGSLLGEKDERMIELKIHNSEPHEVCLDCCWWLMAVLSHSTVVLSPLLPPTPLSSPPLPSSFPPLHSMQPTAEVSWDSSAHDNNSLNVITGNNERVYAILKVCVCMHLTCVRCWLSEELCTHAHRMINQKHKVLRTAPPLCLPQVRVVLKNPPGLVLAVRKRICLRIQKKPSGLASFMRRLTMKARALPQWRVES